jgi:hypothetical protein
MSFAAAVTEPFLRAVAERLASVSLAGVVAGFRHARAFRKDEPEETGASYEERRRSYDEFREAVVRHRVTLGLLAGGTPTVSGAVWTYPIHIRALNRAPDESARLLQTFLSVELNGRGAVIGAAEETLAAMVEVTNSFVPERRRIRQAREAKINAALALVDESVIRFVGTVREDLGYSKPRADDA